MAERMRRGAASAGDELQREHVGLPQLRPEDLGGAKQGVFTISEAEQVDYDFGDNRGVQKRVVLRFAEIKGREYWVNRLGKNMLMDRYGTRLSGWVGKRVPLIEASTEVQGVERTTLQVAEQWDTVMRAGKKGRK